MPYWLETDAFGDDPVWEVLAGGNADRRDRLQAAYCRLKAKSSHLLTDGYLTEDTALRYARNSRYLLDLLTTPVLGRPPRLHRPADECACLDEDWVQGYAYRIHGFLRRNPSRAEYRRNRSQRADLRDARLKAAVYARDGGCCRYCRSGPLSSKAGRARDRRRVLTFDHVDPDAPAGPAGTNLVTACGRCNEHKGHRTPYEADMVLLPVPSLRQAQQWTGETVMLFDVDDEQNHRRITDESPTNHRHDVEPINDPVVVGDADTDGDPIDVTTGPVRPPDDEQRPEQCVISAGKGAGMGRVGNPVSAPQPARPPGAPDVYHRRSRAPADPDRPPYLWPPGAVPAPSRPDGALEER